MQERNLLISTEVKRPRETSFKGQEWAMERAYLCDCVRALAWYGRRKGTSRDIGVRESWCGRALNRAGLTLTALGQSRRQLFAALAAALLTTLALWLKTASLHSRRPDKWQTKP